MGAGEGRGRGRLLCHRVHASCAQNVGRLIRQRWGGAAAEGGAAVSAGRRGCVALGAGEMLCSCVEGVAATAESSVRRPACLGVGAWGVLWARCGG